jgi:hypothetical protein
MFYEAAALLVKNKYSATGINYCSLHLRNKKMFIAFFVLLYKIIHR